MSDGYLGLYQGTVADNSDPTERGAIRCQIPSVLGDKISGWCQPIYPVAPGFVEPVGSIVWIHFANGDLTKPVYFSSGEINADQITAGTIRADLIEATDIYGHIFSTATSPTDTTTYPRLVIDPTAQAFVVAPTISSYGGVFGSYSDDGSGNIASELVIAAPYTHSSTPHYTISSSAAPTYIKLGDYSGAAYAGTYPISVSQGVDVHGWVRSQGLVFSQALEGYQVISNILSGAINLGSIPANTGTGSNYVTGSVSFSTGLGTYSFPHQDGLNGPSVVLTLDYEDTSHAVQAFDLEVRLLGVTSTGFSWAARNNNTSTARSGVIQWIAIGS